jgi:hypothetical protein
MSTVYIPADTTNSMPEVLELNRPTAAFAAVHSCPMVDYYFPLVSHPVLREGIYGWNWLFFADCINGAQQLSAHKALGDTVWNGVN